MNILDLFCGCGGFSLGFQNAGHNIIAAFDNWTPALNCYKNNFSHPVYDCDLSNTDLVTEKLNKLSLTKIDMIIGGPPCQDFSHAGLRSEGTRASLTTAFANIVSNIKPLWFVMENVDRALKSSAYLEAKSIFKVAGYGLTEMVLDASKCGVPQKRKRLFVIGHLDANDNFLMDSLLKNQSHTAMTIRDYLGNKLGVDHYYRHPRNYNRRAIFSIDEPSPTVRGVNRPIPKGYKGHIGDTTELNELLRPLTIQERLLLQTFPESFVLTGSKTEVEQLVGNAVPVNLAKYVANAINDHLSTKQQVKLSNISKSVAYHE